MSAIAVFARGMFCDHQWKGREVVDAAVTSGKWARQSPVRGEMVRLT